MSASSAASGVSLPPGLAATVRVPATSANLGPGFDVMGLALSWHDVVRVEVVPAGLSVQVSGEGVAEVPRDETHLVVRAARAALEHMGVHAPGLALTCWNSIPHGRGLGSSAAAVIAGLTAARALVAGGADRFGDEALLRVATDFEGHPDNVTPCLLGGATLAWERDGQVRALRLVVSPRVAAVVAVPGERLSTSAARGLLPPTVPHADAAANAARAALLVEALSRRPDLLFDATEDRLHQDYREPGMPASLALVRRLRGLGLAAVISGAGPTVLVLHDRGPSADERASLAAATAATGHPAAAQDAGAAVAHRAGEGRVAVLDIVRAACAGQSWLPREAALDVAGAVVIPG